MTTHSTATAPRRRTLSQRLTMLMAAGAVALAGLGASSQPARANIDDLMRFLAGAVVIAAIVNAVDDHNTPRYINRWELPNACLEGMRTGPRTVQTYNAACLERAGYRDLPWRCRVDFHVDYGTRPGYVAECLWNAGYRREGGWSDRRPYSEPTVRPRHRALPEECSVVYRQDGDRRRGYWGGCLQDKGFRNLPEQCRLNTTDGRTLFNARCLSDTGYDTRR